MKNPFHKGDSKTFTRLVRPEDCAGFDNGKVHDVYSTFALARDAEWSGRLFVLEMLEPGEEGMGIHLSIDHLSPAPLGGKVCITSILENVEGNKVTTGFEVRYQDRTVARGRQVQKVLPLEKIDRIISETR